jgi:hypothetical protein
MNFPSAAGRPLFIAGFDVVWSEGRLEMHTRLARIAAATTLFVLGCSGQAGAHERISRFPVSLECENGRSYRIQPLAVSDMGDIVTAYVATGRGRIHVRLVPMGDGYRYAGRGIWFDGNFQEAVMYFGTPAAVPCAVLFN